MTRLTPTPQPKTPRGMRTHRQRASLGTAIAFGLGLFILGGIGWMTLSSAGRPGRPTPAAPPPPPRTVGTPTTGEETQIVGLSDVRIELLDQSDPSRKAGLLTFADMDPLEGRRYAVNEPDGLIYMRDGGAIRIRAANGTLYMPDRAKEPESGTLEGGVRIEFFERRVDGLAIDPGRDPVQATFTTPTLRFDTALGSVTTSERFTLESEQVSLAAQGLNILMNRAAQRLELAEITSSGVLRIRPERAGRTPGSTAAAKPSTAAKEPAGAAAVPTAQAAASVVKTRPATPVHYRADFRQGVTLSESRRALAARRLEVWARLVDNQLAPGAIVPIRTVSVRPPQTPVPASLLPRGVGGEWWASWRSDSDSSVPMAGAPAWRAAEPSGPLEIALAWEGSCMIAPLIEAPAELSRDEVALRFSGDAGVPVTLRDSTPGGTNASGAADGIEYFATTRRLVLDSAAAGATTLDLPQSGRAEGRRIEAALGAGLVRFVGPARFTLAAARRAGASATASEQTDVTLDLRDGALTGQVRQLAFTGDVKAVDEQGSIAAGFVRVDLAPGVARNRVSRVIAEDAVVATARDARLQAERADVVFDPSTDDVAPRQLSASGEVEVSRSGQLLAGDELEAGLVGGGGTPVEISGVRARGGVRFADAAQGTSAEAETLVGAFETTGERASRRQRVELAGANAFVRRALNGESSEVRGSAIELEGPSPAMRVVGAGTFRHERPGGAGMQTLSAAWSESMRFDDAAGTVDAVGQASAVAHVDERSRDRVDAERIELTLARGAPGGGVGAEGASRSLASARAIGAPGRLARVESRRYDAPIEAGGRLERVLALDGPRIELDQAAGTLVVPEAGRLLVRDARQRSELAATETVKTGLAGGEGSRGDALFQWDGSLTYNRVSGEAELTRNVRLTHRRLQDGQITAMNCDRAVAMVRVDDAGTTGTQLSSVRATGTVSVVSGAAMTTGQAPPPQREMVADVAEYDAVRGVIRAGGSPGRLVRFFDTSSGSPVSAAGVVWDLVQDRISIEQMSTVTAPR